MTEERLLNRSFLLCSLSNLLQGTSFHLFLHLPGYLKDLGAREGEIGLIWGLAAVAAIAVRPALGRSMDRRGRRRVILLGNFLNVFAVALYLTVQQVGLPVYGIRMLHGISEAMLFTSLFTYAADHVPARRLTQGLALFGVSGMATLALGSVLGDIILARADYMALFAVSVGFAFLGLISALPLYDRPRAAVDPQNKPRGFRAALLQPDLIPLWWITLVFATSLASIFAFLKTFVMAHDVGTVGRFFTVYTLTGILLRVSFGWVPDRLGPKRLLVPAFGMLALGFFVLAQAESARDVLVAGILCGLGHGSTFPILFGMTVKRARDTERGSALSIYTALFDMGILIGSPLLGYVIEIWGYGPMYNTTAVFLIMGIATFGLWDRGH